MYTLAKRLFDLLTCILLFVVFFPLLVVISLAILIEGRGPVFFKQERAGKDGVPFTIFKFRTLLIKAHDTSDPQSVATPLGLFLRRWGLDELPQLWNVWKGDMSVVGPRPTLLEQVAQYTDHEKKRLQVRPGITGWAQIHGRNAIDWPQRIELDIHYVERASIHLDASILIRTPFALLSGTGTYGPQGINPTYSSP